MKVHSHRQYRRHTGSAAVVIALLVFMWNSTVLAAELTGRLIIVSSFPETVFGRFKSAFEAKNPSLKVHVRSKKTSAAISFIQEAKAESVDLLWLSAPDAFEVLKKSGHLAQAFEVPVEKIQRIGGYPVDDPEGYYRGFAVSGYGIMWNRAYLERHGLPEPQEWTDLRNPEFMGHLGISAPSRSGSMHLIIETILQGQGWTEGWATIMEIASNLATVTARSFGVLDGVKKGRFGAGPVIDFFGLSAMATDPAIGFTYPDNTVFLPANIAIAKARQNPEAARAFVDFILSSEGQRILLEPEISRLPVDHRIYESVERGYPNPFEEKLIRKGITFDTELSRTRYHLVNSLFDTMITYRLRAYTNTWRALREAEVVSSKKSNSFEQAQLKQARRLLTRVPVSEEQANDPNFSKEFVRRKPGLPVPVRQVELEQEWTKFALVNQSKALNLSQKIIDNSSADNLVLQ